MSLIGELEEVATRVAYAGWSVHATVIRQAVAKLQEMERELTALGEDKKRFESAYLGMRTERDTLIAHLRACCPPMPPGVLENEVTLRLKGLDPKRVKVWSESGKILRIDMLADDPIKEEAHNLAALHSLQGIPVDAIERVLREVRK